MTLTLAEPLHSPNKPGFYRVFFACTQEARIDRTEKIFGFYASSLCGGSPKVGVGDVRGRPVPCVGVALSLGLAWRIRIPT